MQFYRILLLAIFTLFYGYSNAQFDEETLRYLSKKYKAEIKPDLINEDGLFYIRTKNGKIGLYQYYDRRNIKRLIPPKYDWIGTSKNYGTIVKKHGKYGIYKYYEKQFILPINYLKIDDSEEYRSKGLFAIQNKNGLWVNDMVIGDYSSILFNDKTRS